MLLVDYGDHFEHNDHRLSNINFLQYSDALWRVIAGNRYMYMNRLRHDAMLTLFQRASRKPSASHLKWTPSHSRS